MLAAAEGARRRGAPGRAGGPATGVGGRLRRQRRREPANALAAAAPCGRLVHVSSPSVAFDGGPAVGAGAEPARYAGRDAYTRTKAWPSGWCSSGRRCRPWCSGPTWSGGRATPSSIGRIVDRARQGRLALPDHGRALVDTTFVDDAAAAVVAGLDRTADSEEAVGRAWVVTGDDPRPLAELVEGILPAAGLRPGSGRCRRPWRRSPAGWSGRFWPGDEPPLTHFAARQLSVAHWFDQAATQRVLRWRPRSGSTRGWPGWPPGTPRR